MITKPYLQFTFVYKQREKPKAKQICLEANLFVERQICQRLANQTHVGNIRDMCSSSVLTNLLSFHLVSLSLIIQDKSYNKDYNVDNQVISRN